ncbi:MAG: hypothetical protein QOD66_1242 [Solirubrobacteraceae bacterium]|nr:hypothetical protein [Solirubrobacteraceae bacterium]
MSTQALAPTPASNIALIDLLDRLLQGGIVIQGDVILSAAEIDLVKLDLRILIAAIDKAAGR